MGQPSFWDNPEKAQQVIGQLKPLNGLLTPFGALEDAAADLQALAELTDEDASLEPELDAELTRIVPRLDEFELRAMLNGPQDASNAFVKIQAGSGGSGAGHNVVDLRLRDHQGWWPLCGETEAHSTGSPKSG